MPLPSLRGKTKNKPQASSKQLGPNVCQTWSWTWHGLTALGVTWPTVPTESVARVPNPLKQKIHPVGTNKNQQDSPNCWNLRDRLRSCCLNSLPQVKQHEAPVPGTTRSAIDGRVKTKQKNQHSSNNQAATTTKLHEAITCWNNFNFSGPNAVAKFPQELSEGSEWHGTLHRLATLFLHPMAHGHLERRNGTATVFASTCLVSFLLFGDAWWVVRFYCCQLLFFSLTLLERTGSPSRCLQGSIGGSQGCRSPSTTVPHLGRVSHQLGPFLTQKSGLLQLPEVQHQGQGGQEAEEP